MGFGSVRGVRARRGFENTPETEVAPVVSLSCFLNLWHYNCSHRRPAKFSAERKQQFALLIYIFLFLNNKNYYYYFNAMEVEPCSSTRFLQWEQEMVFVLPGGFSPDGMG